MIGLLTVVLFTFIIVVALKLRFIEQEMDSLYIMIMELRKKK